uniref:CLASP 1/2 n=1 Tax=Halisarca dujardinii TaxID=2583056 RepID=A0A9F1UC68_HALDU|nr:CLASP 1/2 [Halisarca dujardinii]
METQLTKGVLQTNTTARLQIADRLHEFLSKDDASLDSFDDPGELVEGLVAWLGSSHFKVSINAMDLIGLLCGKSKIVVKHRLSSILPALRERLGDLKDQVRVKATQLFITVMDAELQQPNMLLEEFLMPALVHKNWRVREESMECLIQAVVRYGTQGMGLNKFVGGLCRLLEDPNPQVRTKSVDALVSMYKAVGEKVRQDIVKKGIPQAKLTSLMAKFDEMQANGEGPEQTDSISPAPQSDSGYGPPVPRKKPSTSASKVPAPAAGVPRAAPSGAVGEDTFQKAFQDTPTVPVRSCRDLQSDMSQIQNVLEDDHKGWELRMQSLKRLRGVVKGGALEYEEFHQMVRNLEKAFMTSVKDLRSQICREACISVSFMAVYLKSSFEHIAERLLTPLIILLPNAAKVMAASADVCIYFLIKNIHGPHLLAPILQTVRESKSGVSRNHCCQYLDVITHTWDGHILERHQAALESTIVKGLTDADGQARLFIRRAFWGYHSKFPARADIMFDAFDAIRQRQLHDEQDTHDHPVSSSKRSIATAKPGKRRSASSVASEPDLIRALVQEGALSKASLSRLDLPATSSAVSIDGTGGRGGSATQMAQKVRRSKTPTSFVDRRAMGGSQENLLDGVGSRFAGRGGDTMTPGFKRPSSSMAMHSTRKPAGSRLKPPAGSQHKSRSVNPSPSVSRDSSPGRYSVSGTSSYSRPSSRSRGMELTTEALLSITSQYGSLTRNRDDEDETGSVVSVGSSFSVSSEMSTFSPHSKFANPVENVSELLSLSCSPQWGERRDAIAQLQLLLEAERELSIPDRNIAKEIFKRMLVESHTKVFTVFLDVLCLFISQYHEDLEDWLFKILLRLLHKKGSDMLSSVMNRLTHVFEVIRSTYSASSQLHVLCQIVADKAQPMNHKSKLAWLEYYLALVDKLEPGDFTNTPNTRQALTKIITMATEPKSADIRKLARRTLVNLYKYNTSVLTKMIQAFPQQLQDTAEGILKSYTQTLASSDDSDDTESPVSSPIRKTAPLLAERATPSARYKNSSVSPLIQRKASVEPTTPSSAHSRRIGSGTPGSAMGGSASRLKRSQQTMGSTPDIRAKTPSSSSSAAGRTPRTGIPTPSSSRIPHAGGTPRSRPTTPSGNSSHHYTARPKSTDPRRALLSRPTSAKSDYSPGRGHNGQDSLMSQYALGRLSQLSYGDDSTEFDVDHVGRAIKQLAAAENNVELRVKALQTLLGLARNPAHCNWDEHSSRVLHKLMELMQADQSGEVKVLALRVLREVVKISPDLLKNITELVITKVLKACQDKEANKTGVEDVLPILSERVDPMRALPQLIQLVSTEDFPEVLSAMKMLSAVIPRCSKDLISEHIKDLMESLLKLFGHPESTVRKSSVFCLVAVHQVAPEDMEAHLTTLTTSQRKLLNIYIKKAQNSSSSSSSSSAFSSLTAS